MSHGRARARGAVAVNAAPWCAFSSEGKDLRVVGSLGDIAVGREWCVAPPQRRRRSQKPSTNCGRGTLPKEQTTLLSDSWSAHCMWPEQRSAGGGSSSDKQRRATEHATTHKQVRERARHKKAPPTPASSCHPSSPWPCPAKCDSKDVVRVPTDTLSQ